MNYTVKQFMEFKRRKEAGEQLTPRILEKLEKFLAKGKKNEPTSVNPTGSGSPAPGPGREEGKEASQGSEPAAGASQASDAPAGPAASSSAPAGPGVTPPEVKAFDAGAVVGHLIENQTPPSNVPLPIPAEVPKPKGGRKAAVAQVGPTAAEQKRLKCRANGYAFADMLVMGGYTFMGPEWNYQPVQKNGKGEVIFDERAAFGGAYADMFEHYGWDYIPPWAGALTATTTFVVARTRMPQTQAKIQKAVTSGMLARVKGWFQRKPKPQPPPVPEQKQN